MSWYSFYQLSHAIICFKVDKINTFNLLIRLADSDSKKKLAFAVLNSCLPQAPRYLIITKSFQKQISVSMSVQIHVKLLKCP